MSASRLALLALSCFVFLGCGDDEKSPAEKCDDLVADMCARGAECLGGGSSDEQECVAAIKAEIACGDADAVSDNYNRCIDQINTNSCSSLFPVNPDSGQQELVLPADCEAVILDEDA